jgi:hypothetical protein
VSGSDFGIFINLEKSNPVEGSRYKAPATAQKKLPPFKILHPEMVCFLTRSLCIVSAATQILPWLYRNITAVPTLAELMKASAPAKNNQCRHF